MRPYPATLHPGYLLLCKRTLSYLDMVPDLHVQVDSFLTW